MNQTEASKFRGLLKILDIIYLIAISLISLAFALIFALTIYISTQSESTIKKILTASNSKLSMTIAQTKYEFANEYLQNHLIVDKDLLLFVMVTGLFNLALTLAIVWFARKLIQAFKKDQFFHKQNGNYIEVIAWLVLILGHTYQAMVSLIGFLAMQSTQLDSYLIDQHVIESVTHQFMGIDFNIILIAVTIWFIGRAFKYGAYLQEEYDATV